jgi:hypothetical protein
MAHCNIGTADGTTFGHFRELTSILDFTSFRISNHGMSLLLRIASEQDDRNTFLLLTFNAPIQGVKLKLFHKRNKIDEFTTFACCAPSNALKGKVLEFLQYVTWEGIILPKEITEIKCNNTILKNIWYDTADLVYKATANNKSSSTRSFSSLPAATNRTIQIATPNPLSIGLESLMARLEDIVRRLEALEAGRMSESSR